MPILKHAKKKILVDKKRTLHNKVVKSKVASSVKKFKQSPSAEALREVFSTLDRAAKKDVFHTGKVDRLKGRLSKLLKGTETVEKKVKKAVVKVAKKA
jgi:ribosomal protein S20